MFQKKSAQKVGTKFSTVVLAIYFTRDKIVAIECIQMVHIFWYIHGRIIAQNDFIIPNVNRIVQCKRDVIAFHTNASM